MANEITLQQAQDMVATPQRTNSMLSTREAQEVQAAVFMAKRFPRNENESLARILRACDRVGLATKAFYSYPKGGSQVSGPSVRLAEAMAQAWGNIQSGVVELEQRDGESMCMAYCWDIETNTRECKIFTVKHQISTKNGMKVLTDPRDIYEQVANQGARRKRACILNIIPGDIVDEAVARCNKTLQGNNRRPLIDRLREVVDFFQTRYSVPLSSIEKYFGYPLDVFTEQDGITLTGIYNSLKDGVAKREDYFQLPKIPAAEDAPQSDNPDTKPGTTPEPKSDSPDAKADKKPNSSKSRQVSIYDL